MSHLRNTLAILVMVCCSCTTTGHSGLENLKSIPEGKGVLLFSTGASKTNLSFSTGLSLVNGKTHKKYDGVVINIDYPFPSNFKTEHGHVVTLVLPAGEYYLIPRSGNPAFVMKNAPVYGFNVINGKVCYIGNFFLNGNALT